MFSVYTGSVTMNEERRSSFTSLLTMLAVSEDIGECVRPAQQLNGSPPTNTTCSSPATRPEPPQLIPLEDGDADAENEDEEEEEELQRPTVFETNLGGGVTLQRIPAKSSRKESGKVCGNFCNFCLPVPVQYQSV
jgi:hypothetical protein